MTESNRIEFLSKKLLNIWHMAT